MTAMQRLRHIAIINPSTPEFDRLPMEAEVTFMPLETVWSDDRVDMSRSRTKRDVVVGYTRFRDGDVLVPKVTPTFQAGRSAIVDGLINGVGAGTTELHVLRARPGVDARFLKYVTLSSPFLIEGTSAFQGVAGLQRVPDEFVKDFPVVRLDLAGQRRIAHFLDMEIAAIDRIIHRRSRQRQALVERASSVVSELLVPGILSEPSGVGAWPWLPKLQIGSRLVKLGMVCRLQSGLTLDGNRKVGGDSVTRPYLRVANVQAGEIRLDEVAEVVIPRAMVSRFALRQGDVLMTEGGDLDKLGRGAVWAGEIPECLHQNHVFALRPDLSRLDPSYLMYMTHTVHGRCYFESTGVKTTNLASTNSSKILGFPVPLPDVQRQRVLVRQVQAALGDIERAQSGLARQLEVLVERRQALITAAVIGQVDVSTARGIEV